MQYRQVKKTTADEIIANKNRLIGELYSRCRTLEDAYAELQKECDALKKKVANGNYKPVLTDSNN